MVDNRAGAGVPVKGSPYWDPTAMGARWFVLLAALMAFSWQSFATQTHLHIYPGTRSVATAAGVVVSSQLTTGRSPTDEPANCPICQEMAHAGHYLLPTPIAFVAPQTSAPWLVVTPTVALLLRQPPRPWNSRAPPYPLHA